MGVISLPTSKMVLVQGRESDREHNVNIICSYLNLVKNQRISLQVITVLYFCRDFGENICYFH